MPTRTVHPVLCLVLAVPVIAGCGRSLMPTPNLHRGQGADPFTDVPEARRTTTVEIVYATDRLPTSRPNEPTRYGAGRSPSLAFGTTRVRIGEPSLTWEELVSASRTGERTGSLTLHPVDTEEHVRLPVTPWYLNLLADPSITEADVKERYLQDAASVREDLGRRVRDAGSGDVYLFVHGFNNTFEAGAMTLAELWHFLGRRGLPVLYSWPASTSGLFGYNPDRESSEFTVSHLKTVIQILASVDGVERVHLIGHSRGTDAIASAIRELHIQCTAQGLDTADALKLENIVLIAADIDHEVSNQRMGVAGLHEACRHLTIYSGAGDTALGLASSMFESSGRLGQIGTDHVTTTGRVVLDHLADDVTIVHQPRKVGFTGHAYFIHDPRSSSDLILLLTGHQRPGAAHGRPLEQDPSGVWVIPREYPGADGAWSPERSRAAPR